MDMKQALNYRALPPPQRPAYPSEDAFFSQSGVPGYAAPDNSVVLSNNPAPGVNMDAVRQNETYRTLMRQGVLPQPSFPITEDQRAAFDGYGNEGDIRATIAARIATGDPSVLGATEEQQNFTRENLGAPGNGDFGLLAGSPPQDIRQALTLDDRMSEFGMDPKAKRNMLLPLPTDMRTEADPRKWDMSDWTAPEWLYEGARALNLPGHVARGGDYEAKDVTDMGLALMGMGTTGAAMGMSPRGSLGMFAGRGAKTADLDQMKQAESMLDSGADRADVWQQTGWMRGPDGKMRFEIDDSGARLDMDAIPSNESRLDVAGGFFEATHGIPRSKMFTGQNPIWDKEALAWADENMNIARDGDTPMSNAMSHDDAFAAYPDMEKIRLGRETGKAYGSFNPGDNKIKVGGGPIGQGVDRPRSTALHELQHAIQQQEGFAPGASPSSAYMDNALRKQWGEEINSLLQPRSRKEYLKILKAGWPEATPKQLDASYRSYLKDAKKSLNDPYHPAAKAAQETAAGRIYKRSAGEVEARNVQTRMDMTPEQRLAQPPWTTLDVPEADQIVRGARKPTITPEMMDALLYSTGGA